MPMKAQPYLYRILLISLDPISLNHYWLASDKLVTQSSLQAATTIMPSGKSLMINYSKVADDLKVSKHLANSTLPFYWFIRTMCRPLWCPFAFFSTSTCLLFIVIFAKFPASKPADDASTTAIEN